VKSTDSAAESDPAVAAVVRLLHRRRGWIWATAISVAAFLVACGLLGARAPDASGAGVGVASVFILLLAATAVVGLVAAIVDTVRVHRLEPGVRAQAAPRTVHYPVRAHAYRYPPRHRWTWVFSWLVMAILLGLGCSTITNGYLGTGSNAAPATWPGQVPIGVPFTVREPVWNWGFGAQLINGDGSAIAYIVLGVLLDGFAVLILFAIYKTVRQWRRHRQHAGSGLAIS
jgi:hypothetical protein